MRGAAFTIKLAKKYHFRHYRDTSNVQSAAYRKRGSHTTGVRAQTRGDTKYTAHATVHETNAKETVVITPAARSTAAPMVKGVVREKNEIV